MTTFFERGLTPGTWLHCAGRPVEARWFVERLEEMAGRLREASGARAVIAVRYATPLDALIACFAIWRVDACPLLLGPRYPEETSRRLAHSGGARLLVAPDGAFAKIDDAPANAPPGIAALFCTSGTMGTPKLVAHSWESLHASASGAIEVFPPLAGGRWLLTLPLHHVGGFAILVRCLLAGAVVVLPDARCSLVENLDAVRPTHLSLVSTQLRRLVADASAGAALAACRMVLLGGGPVPVSLRTKAIARGLTTWVGYGSTETASLVTAAFDPGDVQQPWCAGRVLPERRLRVSADGEIAVGGPVLAAGVFEAGALKPLAGPDGFHRMGDRGSLDPTLRLFVNGRTDAMFISGGENVHPEEIELALASLESVVSAIVVPIDDEEFDARPAAFLELEAGSEARASAIRADLGRTLPRFKIPVAFWLLPGAGLEKPSRAELRALANDPLARARLAPLREH